MTFTILALGAGGDALAVATASYSLAVGNSVPAIRPGIGAVASQSWTNRALRSATLDAIEAGDPPGVALDGLAAIDDGIQYRQIGVMTADGASAAFTGSACSGWAGHRAGEGYLVLGNLLTGPAVLDAMVDELECGRAEANAGGIAAVAAWVLAALAAGDAAGGDRRGRQSAAVQLGSARADASVRPPELAVDLRVDDAAQPIAELRRLVGLDGAIRTG